MTPSFHHDMEQHKKYKSLDKVYLEKSFAKPVPPLPRQLVLGKFCEAARPGILPDPGKPVQYYFKEPGFAPEDLPTIPKTRKITDPLTQKKKTVKTEFAGTPYEIPGEIKKGESELISLALKLFRGKGQGIESAAREMISKLREISYSEDANEEFKKVKDNLLKLLNTENQIKDLPPENTVFYLVKEIQDKTGKANYSPDLIFSLLNTAGKGSTNLGKVELGLTIFYANAKKAARGGDVEIQRSLYNGVPIEINSISYEVKGPDGRMGDGEDNRALYNLEKYMNDFYKKHNINKEYRIIKPGGRSRILIDNIMLSAKEILDISDSTIKELCDLILHSSPKPITPENVISDFYNTMEGLKKEDFYGEEKLTLISTALQMYTYRETDGHKFKKLFAYKGNSPEAMKALVLDVSKLDFLGYYSLIATHFKVTKPTTDSKYSAFGIELL
jgi:hypothetical protein